tara:strand:+ start:11011 stop:11403 length:393 start_codon:yes stop_codon:yes gene_type:complete
MSKFLFGIIFVMSVGLSYMWYENQNLKKLNIAYETRDAQQKQTLDKLQKDFALQSKSLLNLQAKNQKIQKEMDNYLAIFRRHNLTKLAIAKPNLIQTRVNNGTKQVFNNIEEISRIIDSADDFKLQSDTK